MNHSTCQNYMNEIFIHHYSKNNIARNRSREEEVFTTMKLKGKSGNKLIK